MAPAPVTTRKCSSDRSRHRDVGDDAAGLVEELRVDHRADGPIHPVVATRSSRASAPGPRTAILPKDDKSMIPTRSRKAACSLASDRGTAAATSRTRVGPRRLAATPPWREVVGTLPAVLRAEDRAELLEPPVQGTQPLGLDRPPRSRTGSAAGSSTCTTSRAVSALATSYRGTGRRTATGGTAGRRSRSRPSSSSSARLRPRPPAPPKPFSDRPAATQKPRTPASARAGVAVRRHRIWVAEQAKHARLVEHREPSDRSFSSGAKRSVSDWTPAGAVVPRDAVRPARDGVRFVPADQQPSGLGLAVDEVVGIAKARQLARDLVAGHRLHGHVLMIDGNRRSKRPDHRRDAAAPTSWRVDDRVRLDSPWSVTTAWTAPSRAALDAGDERSRADLHAEGASPRPPHGWRCADRRSRRPASTPPPYSDRGAVRLGHEPLGLRRGDQLRLEARPRAAWLAPRRRSSRPRRARGDPHAAHRLEDLAARDRATL